MKESDAVARTRSTAAVLVVFALLGAVVHAAPEAPGDKSPFKPEELEQMLAPIALYPDSLLTQMLMASTYPLEVVQGDRWVKANKNHKGDALTKALEAQSWDPSVKSLVNFPPVLAMMSEKLDLTVKVGDAFIGQRKEVMATIQKLRAKAHENGNLKTTSEQKVVVDNQGGTQVIIIEPAEPDVVYVPTYPSTVYYAVWPYPAYRPVPYYPPGYVAGKGVAFGAGVAVGAAWGYAWGHSDWHGASVDIDVNRNASINTNINRSSYRAQLEASNTSVRNGRGTFEHDAAHRHGVAYRDRNTATHYGRTSSAEAVRSRDSFRGRDAGGAGTGFGQRPAPTASNNAFDGVSRGGSAARKESLRGSSSRSVSSRSAGSMRFGGRR